MNYGLPRWPIISFLLFCYGCFGSTAMTSYYTLNPTWSEAMAAESGTSDRLVIGMGPVTVPDYLDRPAIVTRGGPNRLEVHEDHRWAGTLQSEVLRALAANLEAMTGAGQVVMIPWGVQMEPDLRFRIDIQAFEGDRDGKVRLKAAWSMTPSRSDQPAVQRVTRIEEDAQSGNYDALAAAMGRALTSLSRQMADAVFKAVRVHE